MYQSNKLDYYNKIEYLPNKNLATFIKLYKIFNFKLNFDSCNFLTIKLLKKNYNDK